MTAEGALLSEAQFLHNHLQRCSFNQSSQIWFHSPETAQCDYPCIARQCTSRRAILMPMPYCAGPDAVCTSYRLECPYKEFLVLSSPKRILLSPFPYAQRLVIARRRKASVVIEEGNCVHSAQVSVVFLRYLARARVPLHNNTSRMHEKSLKLTQMIFLSCMPLRNR